MFRTENSPEFEAEMKRYDEEQEREGKESKIARVTVIKLAWPNGAPWLPIDTCPFKAFEYATIYVTNGEKVTGAQVHKRFGTPVFYEKAPELVMRDGKMWNVGGVKMKVERPEWWWKWELGNWEGEDFDEIGFIPTHWLPEPPPVKMSIVKSLSVKMTFGPPRAKGIGLLVRG